MVDEDGRATGKSTRRSIQGMFKLGVASCSERAEETRDRSPLLLDDAILRGLYESMSGTDCGAAWRPFSAQTQTRFHKYTTNAAHVLHSHGHHSAARDPDIRTTASASPTPLLSFLQPPPPPPPPCPSTPTPLPTPASTSPSI